MKNIILIILINFLFSNVNFEILNLPIDIYSQNSNNGVLNTIQNINNPNLNYKTNFLKLPDNVMLYNLSKDEYTMLAKNASESNKQHSMHSIINKLIKIYKND